MNYAIFIMYLFILKILICSPSCFTFVKSCIAPCNVVNSDWILLLLTIRRTCRPHNELEIAHCSTKFSFIVRLASLSNCKQNTHLIGWEQLISLEMLDIESVFVVCLVECTVLFCAVFSYFKKFFLFYFRMLFLLVAIYHSKLCTY